MHTQTMEEMVRNIVRTELEVILPTMLQNPDEKYLSTKDVAALTGLSIAFFEGRRSAEAADQPPFIRLGRRIVYKQSAVEAWTPRR